VGQIALPSAAHHLIEAGPHQFVQLLADGLAGAVPDCRLQDLGVDALGIAEAVPMHAVAGMAAVVQLPLPVALHLVPGRDGSRAGLTAVEQVCSALAERLQHGLDAAFTCWPSCGCPAIALQGFHNRSLLVGSPDGPTRHLDPVILPLLTRPQLGHGAHPVPLDVQLAELLRLDELTLAVEPRPGRVNKVAQDARHRGRVPASRLAARCADATRFEFAADATRGRAIEGQFAHQQDDLQGFHLALVEVLGPALRHRLARLHGPRRDLPRRHHVPAIGCAEVGEAALELRLHAPLGFVRDVVALILRHHQEHVHLRLEPAGILIPAEVAQEHSGPGFAEHADGRKATFHVACEAVHPRERNGVGLAFADHREGQLDRRPVEVRAAVSLVLDHHLGRDVAVELVGQQLELVALAVEAVVADLLQQANPLDPDGDPPRLRHHSCCGH
jgi:hypothetical protein